MLQTNHQCTTKFHLCQERLEEITLQSNYWSQ